MIVAVRRVVGQSMAPTLLPGTVVVLIRLPRRLRVGDVVLLKHEGLDKIKRIATITGAKVFVTGDNALQSTDSRTFGWLPRKVILGVAVWPRGLSKPNQG